MNPQPNPQSSTSLPVSNPTPCQTCGVVNVTPFCKACGAHLQEPKSGWQLGTTLGLLLSVLGLRQIALFLLPLGLALGWSLNLNLSLLFAPVFPWDMWTLALFILVLCQLIALAGLGLSQTFHLFPSPSNIPRHSNFEARPSTHVLFIVEAIFWLLTGSFFLILLESNAAFLTSLDFVPPSSREYFMALVLILDVLLLPFLVEPLRLYCIRGLEAEGLSLSSALVASAFICALIQWTLGVIRPPFLVVVSWGLILGFQMQKSRHLISAVLTHIALSFIVFSLTFQSLLGLSSFWSLLAIPGLLLGVVAISLGILSLFKLGWNNREALKFWRQRFPPSLTTFKAGALPIVVTLGGIAALVTLPIELYERFGSEVGVSPPMWGLWGLYWLLIGGVAFKLVHQMKQREAHRKWQA